MDAPHKIEIHATKAGIGTKIVIDGHEVRNVTKAELVITAAGISQLNLSILTLDGVEVHGELGQVLYVPEK